MTPPPDLPPLPDLNGPAGGEAPVGPSAPGQAPGSGHPPAPYPEPPGAPVAPLAPRIDGRAVAALVCAILSWFLGPIVLAIAALVLARSAEQAIDAAPAELTGRGLVSGARWVAWVNLVLAAMVIAFLSAFAIAVWIGR